MVHVPVMFHHFAPAPPTGVQIMIIHNIFAIFGFGAFMLVLLGI